MHTTNQDKSGANSGCFYCGKPGHMKKDCRKRLADLQRKERGGENFSGPLVAFSAFDKEQKGIWVVDSGSTQHLTGNLEGMLEVRPLQPPEEIRVTGESTVKATHVGRVKLDCKVGNLCPCLLKPEQSAPFAFPKRLGRSCLQFPAA
jgi:hypothetical protein